MSNINPVNYGNYSNHNYRLPAPPATQPQEVDYTFQPHTTSQTTSTSSNLANSLLNRVQSFLSNLRGIFDNFLNRLRQTTTPPIAVGLVQPPIIVGLPPVIEPPVLRLPPEEPPIAIGLVAPPYQPEPYPIAGLPAPVDPDPYLTPWPPNVYGLPPEPEPYIDPIESEY